MRKVLISLGVVGVLVIALVLTPVLVLRSGPTGPVPAEDPAIRLNREHANLEDNAATVYREAFALLSPGPPSETNDWEPGEPVPAAAVEWIAENEAAITKALEAADHANCWFDLRRDPSGLILMPEQKDLRTLAKLFAWRVRLAGERHDADTVAESLLAIDAFGRHAAQTPTLLSNLVSIACLGLGQSMMLEPYGWETLSPAQRSVYTERVAPCLAAPPSLDAALAQELEEGVWMYTNQIGAVGSSAMRILASPGRVSAELQRYIDPLRELAAQPIEQQLDPGNRIRQRLETMENEQPSAWNAPRWMAKLVSPSLLRALELRGRLITEQRGKRTVMELFALRDQVGEFPESLDVIEGNYKVDPFTGYPFVYHLTDDGFTLYSAGVDRDDDGGRHDAHFGERQTSGPGPAPPPDGDYVFWPRPGS